MDENQFDSQGTSADDAGRPEDGSASEDARPEALRPQAMAEAELKPIPPRLREQALPEKDDDRFFDRWVVDRARTLGFRAVRPPAVDRLRQTVRAFAEWRSLRHQPKADRESMEDRALVASTPERIKNANAEAVQLEADAEKVEEEAERQERDAEDAEERYFQLRPALRGKDRVDFSLTAVANAVVLGADFYIIQIALKTIPAGSVVQHRFTALMLGAGAVVIGDVLGWMAAAGSIRRDGSIQRPDAATVISVAALLILAVWFFGELGQFREHGLEVARNEDAPAIGSPTFFTIAQILFLIGAAIVSFAYVARRTGRELKVTYGRAVARQTALRAKAESLRGRAVEARRRATEAPALRLAAEERIRSRDKVAKGNVRLDIKQGEYLDSLVVPEYMHERAGVESGVGFWQIGGRMGMRWLRLGLWPTLALGVATTLAAGGIAQWVMDSLLISVATGVIVAIAYAALVVGKNGGSEVAGGPLRYIAQFFPEAREGNERASDIDHIVPFDPGDGPPAAATNGGHRLSRRELEERYERLREVFNDGGA